jgi:hypothetical protein
LDANIAHADGVTKKQAAQNLKKCCPPGEGPALAIPTSKSSPEDFDKYNSEALQAFYEHSAQCLFCREKNVEALEAAREAAEAARRKAEEDESRRRGEELCALKQAAEDAEAHRLHEEEALRRALQEEEEHRLADEKRLAEEAARRRLAEAAELARLAAERAAEEAERLRMLAEDEESRRYAAELEEAAERHRRLVAKGQHTYLLKGEGKKAYHEAGKAHQEKLAEKAAKEDIAKYSLNHAKKEGLVAAKDHSHVEETGIEKAASTGTRAVGTVEMVEIEGDLAKNWDAHWTAEEEAQFAQLRS